MLSWSNVAVLGSVLSIEIGVASDLHVVLCKEAQMSELVLVSVFVWADRIIV